MTLCALLLSASLVSLEPYPNPALEQAWRAWDDLDYDRVSRLLDEAATSEMTAEETVRYFELRALVLAIYGDRDAAIEAFRRLLTETPGYTVPAGTAPKIVEALQAARAAVEHSAATPSRSDRPPTAPEPETQPVDGGAAVESVPPAPEEPWRLRMAVDAGSSRVLGSPQGDFYRPWGVGLHLRGGVGRGPIGGELQGALLRFAEREGNRHGIAVLIGAGPTVDLALGETVHLAVGAHGGIARTGQLLRFAIDAGGSLTAAVSHWRIGPSLRYVQILAHQRAGRAQGDARMLSVGLVVGFEPSS